MAIDNNDTVYIVYQQEGAEGISNIYLSRYDGIDVTIWDNTASNWTDQFEDGDPVDTGDTDNALNPQLAIDSNNFVYVTYSQGDSGKEQVYLSRYNKTDVRIWDRDTADWTTSFGLGDPIDTSVDRPAVTPEISVDTDNRVYVTYSEEDSGGTSHIYLTRYNGVNVKIWDSGNADWTTTFTRGGPIDTGPTIDEDASNPQLVTDGKTVYITYEQFSGIPSRIYASRYIDTPAPSSPPSSGGGGSGGCFVGTLLPK